MAEVQVFRRSRFDRFMCGVGFVSAVVFCPLIGFLFLGELPDMRLSTSLVSGFFLIPLLAMAPVLAIGRRGACIRLSDEWVEWRYLFKMQRVRREEIAAWRIPPTASAFELQLTSGRHINLLFKDLSDAVTPLKEWLKDIPDLKAISEAERDALLMSNPAFGDTPEDRALRVSRHRGSAKVISGVSLCVSALAIFIRNEWLFLILMIIPPIVWIAPRYSNGRWTVAWHRYEERLGIGHIALWPMMAAGWMAHGMFTPIDEAMLLVCTLLMAVPLIWVSSAFKPVWVLVCTVPSALAYAFAVLTVVNDVPPPLSSQRYETVVLTKIDGRKSNRLRLAPWGPMLGKRIVTPESALWYAVEEGGTLCISLHTGILGWRYYDYALCGPDARRGTQ